MSESVILEQYGQQQSKDILLCHQVSEVLNKHYEGHPWLVGANHDAGTINVQLTYLDKLGRMFKHGFLLHISKIQSIGDLEKKVMRSGGELLERWKLSRTRATNESWQKAQQNGLITEGALR